jgi:hypothetical protein
MDQGYIVTTTSQYFIISELLDAKIFSILTHYDLTENFSFGLPVCNGFNSTKSLNRTIQKLLSNSNDKPYYFNNENDAKKAVVVIKNSRIPARVAAYLANNFCYKYHIVKKVSNRYHNPKYNFTKSLILN